MIRHDKTGGRVVELFIPFEFNGKKIEAITLAPFRLGHTIRWSEGAWKTALELIAELAGTSEAVLRDLRYPDADRVMEAFLAMVTPDIREDITNGRIPVNQEEERAIDRSINGGGDPIMGPGDPLPHETIELPQAGFDMSEEP
jgi:hypothetical protein